MQKPKSRHSGPQCDAPIRVPASVQESRYILYSNIQLNIDSKSNGTSGIKFKLSQYKSKWIINLGVFISFGKWNEW